MRLVLSLRAEADLDVIAAYLHARNPPASQQVEAELQAASQRLANDPQSGRVIGRGLRRFVVPRLPYLIVYKLDEAAASVLIATIRHAARRPHT